MSCGRLKQAFAAGALSLLAAAAIAPGAAQASHDNGTALCSSKFEGTFRHFQDLPLYRNGPGTKQLGRVVVSTQRTGDKLRVCSVTVRRYHSEPKDTWAFVQRDGAYYRLDRGQFYRYAGPVVGAMKRGQTIRGGGRIVGACAGYEVSWPAGGAPQLNGGGCA